MAGPGQALGPSRHGLGFPREAHTLPPRIEWRVAPLDDIAPSKLSPPAHVPPPFPWVPQVEVLSDATASASKAVQAANLYDLRQVGVSTPSLEEWASGIVAQVAAHSAI
ncbi:hypothetical protein ACKKBF_B00710 [Auxenochlorella protothecoides x Auxenochlorella symbiontica]